MGSVAIPTINSSFKRVGKGDIFLAAHPAVDPGTATLASTVDGYYGLFYTDAAAKKALKGGVKVLCETTIAGLDVKIKPSIVEFEPNNGPKQKLVTGIEEASAEFSFYDADPAHLAHVFGLDATQLLAVAAAAGKAGRKIAAISPTTATGRFVLMFRMPSVQVPGEFDHVLLPNIRLMPDLELKLSQKDKVEVKVQVSVLADDFAIGADGSGVVAIIDAADAPGL